MADPTVSDLLAPPDEDAYRENMLAFLQTVPSFPIDDWESGGVLRTIFELERLVGVDLLSVAIPAMIEAGFVDLAARDFALLDAKQLFNLDARSATFAVQTMTLTRGSGSGTYTISAGQFIFTGPTGNRWFNTSGGSLAASSTLAIQIQAEAPGAQYNDPAGTIVTMSPPLAGVTCANTAGDFTAVGTGVNNLGAGTVTPSRTSGGTPPSRATWVIRIDASGQVGAGAWSYSSDGGLTWASPGVIATTALLLNGGSSGTTVTFANGAGNPSFVAGDFYTFASPGTSYVTLGLDAEATTKLAARCLARWPDLSLPPAQSRYLKWAKAASTEVTRVRLEEDATYLGKLYVTLAGLAGAVSGGAVTAVQNYIDPLAPIGRIIVARAASTVTMSPTGTVTVPAARIAEIQSAAQALWVSYILKTDIGGTVRSAKLEQFLMDAGATDVTGLQINSVTNLALTSTQIPVLSTSAPLLATQLTWRAI